MKPHLQCAEQQVSRSDLTKYGACHAERLTYLIIITYETSLTMRGATGVTIQPHQILRLSRRKTHLLIIIIITYETSFTMRGATGVTIQPHQILRLSWRKTLILSPHHIWNLIYSSWSNRPSRPTSPNTAPATKNDHPTSGRNLRKTAETSFPMRGRSEHDPKMIREWSDHKNANCNPPRNRARSLFELTTSIFYCKIKHFAPNLTFKPSPNTAPATKSDTWPSPSTAPATKRNTRTSPSTAPATKSDTHGSSSWHMKPHLQCAEEPMSPSKLTKYCACHAKWPPNIWQKFAENSWNVISNAGTIRAWSENDPSMIRPWKRKPQPASQPRLLFELARSIFYSKIQHFAPNLTFKPSPNTAPATKSDTWPSPSTAPATKSNTRTSPSIAPATKSDTHGSSSWHMKPHLQCAEQPMSPSKLTKNCACHAKWQPNIWQKFAENSWSVISNAGTIREWSDHDPSMIRPWKRKPQPASQVRLLFELPRSIFYCKIQRFAPNLTFKPSPSAAPATKSDTWPSPSTAPATKSDTRTSPSTAPATKSDTWPSPSTAPATQKDSLT